ncbi:MAG: hypothetical protein ACTSVC_13565, partial [Promethearchaeota archaeon]
MFDPNDQLHNRIAQLSRDLESNVQKIISDQQKNNSVSSIKLKPISIKNRIIDTLNGKLNNLDELIKELLLKEDKKR